MSDLFINNAIEVFIKDLIDQTMWQYPEDIIEMIEKDGPSCTTEEIRSSLDRLVRNGSLNFFEGYYADGRLSRRAMKRFCG